MKNTIIAIVVIIIIGIIGYFMMKSPAAAPIVTNTETGATTTQQNTIPVNKEETVIGKSVEGRDITAYHFGTGATEIILVGGQTRQFWVFSYI